MWIKLLKVLLTAIVLFFFIGVALVLFNLLASGSLSHWSYFQTGGIWIAAVLTTLFTFASIYGIWKS